jgi:hypothetical protein
VNSRARRRGVILAATVVVLAVAVATLPLIQGATMSGDLSGPSIVPHPIVLGLLLSLPGLLALTAAIRGSRPLFVAAGVLALLQSFIAFSGVTLGFVLPALLLIMLGASAGSAVPGSPVTRRERLAGVLVVILGIAAWVAPFATTETVCWTARPGSDGSVVYTIIPNSDTLTVEVGELGSGCDGGSFSIEGLALGGVLAIGALALAGLPIRSTSGPRDPHVVAEAD